MRNHLGNNYVDKAIHFGTRKEDLKTLLPEMQRYAEHIKGLKQAQMRKYFHEVKKSTFEEVILLQPMFAYGIGRIKASADPPRVKEAASEFLESLSDIVGKISTTQHMQNFKKFMEAIVAYHKYYSKA